jgi:hypothetical protein
VDFIVLPRDISLALQRERDLGGMLALKRRSTPPPRLRRLVVANAVEASQIAATESAERRAPANSKPWEVWCRTDGHLDEGAKCRITVYRRSRIIRATWWPPGGLPWPGWRSRSLFRPGGRNRLHGGNPANGSDGLEPAASGVTVWCPLRPGFRITSGIPAPCATTGLAPGYANLCVARRIIGLTPMLGRLPH